MGRKKLIHIQNVGKKENVFDENKKIRGKWNKFFKSDGDIVLEIGCGYGQYTIGLAKKFKDKNFIGMDRKGDRVWYGAEKATEESLNNVAFVNGFAEKLDEYFAEGEISEIWVTFPDPYPKPCKHKRILTSSRFLEIYRKIASKNATIHLKTDNKHVFDYTKAVIQKEDLKTIEEIQNVHAQKEVSELLQITTYYERKFMEQGKDIYYIKFKLN